MREGLTAMTIFSLSPKKYTVRIFNFTSDKCHLASWRRNSSKWNGFQEGKKHSHPSLIFTSCRSQADGTDHRGPLRSQVGDRAPAWSQLSGLTYEIRQQDGEEEGGRDGRQGRAFPAAVLGGLLQLEGLPGERIAGQQAGWWCVNRSWGQRVSRGGAAKQGCASRGRLKEEVPAREEERVRTHILAVEDQSAAPPHSLNSALHSTNIVLIGAS